MPPSIEKIETQITNIDNNLMSFILFCNRDEWEWCALRHNGVEHSLSNPSAVGLVFNKTSAQVMAKALREIADKLDANNDP